MQALGLIETIGLVVAIESADAMLKAADVNILEKTYVGGGLVVIAVTGDVAAVKAAVEAGGAAVKRINSKLLVSQHVIAHPHEELDNVIVSVVPLENAERSTVVSTKTQFKDEPEVEITKEDTAEVPIEIENILVKDLIVEDSVDKKLSTKKLANSLLINLSELPNKEAVDKILLEYSLEEVIKVLSKVKVVELRNLAREYKNFGIVGRSVSRANKKLLLTEFREYYIHN